jgi:hypothetical protein
MANPEKAEILVVSGTWGAAVGICAGFNWDSEESLVAVRDEDSIYDDALGLVGDHVTAELEFIHTAPSRDQATHSLIVVSRNINGKTVTTTITNMYMWKVSESMNRDSPPASYRAMFRSKGHSVITQVTAA